MLRFYDRQTAPRRSTTWWVYALVDSREKYSVRYIGVTNNPYVRLSMHISRAQKEGWKKSRWVQSVYDGGGTVWMWVLAEGLTQQDALKMEVSLIAGYREANFRLMNLTDGGDGVVGQIQSAETREKKRIAMTGLKRSREEVEKRAAKLRGRKVSDETRTKMKASHLKRYSDNPEQAEKQRINNIKRFSDPEERRKTSEANYKSYENNPERRQRLSEIGRKRFENPAEREKISIANRKRAGKESIRKSNTSGFKGVSFKKENGKWAAYVGERGKRRYLGYFESAESAALAHDVASIQIYGNDCYLNFPLERTTA